ncbi:MAG: sodium/solute symporter, partial [Alphaproteobacteria bacterium]|nr:sodium/solute symporter [Alphaproteobacteria bacterium]
MPHFNVELHPIDITILVIYFVSVMALGIYLGRKYEDGEDYFLAGRKMTWPFICLSLFASNISSTTLIGLAGEAYGSGISVFNYEWMAAVVLVFFAIFILPFVLRSRVYTMPEFLERRFDGRARIYFSALTIFLNIVVDTAGSLFAGALVIQMIFPDVAIWQTIAILAVVSGIYTITGGLAAVIYTDAIQAILLLVGSLVITVVAFNKIGSWANVVARVSPDKLSLIRPLGDPNVPWLGLLVGIPLLGFYFWCTNQFMVQRVLSAKNIDHGRWGSLFAGALKLPVLFIMVLPGTFAILLYPDLPRPDLVYPTLLFDLLPAGLLGLVLAGFIAALMSQIDSTLNSASTLVTMDFISKFHPNISNRRLLTVGRYVTFIIMILAVIWAPQIGDFSSLFKYLQKVLAYAIPPVVTLFLIGSFWKRPHANAAFTMIIIGNLASVALFLAIEVFKVIHLHFLYVPPILFVFCSAILTIFTLMTPNKTNEQSDALVWTKAIYDAETLELKD